MTVRRAPMWSGQRAFRNLAQADARELVRQLDNTIDPHVAVVGVRWDEGSAGDEHPDVSVEPEGREDLATALEGVREAVMARSGDGSFLLDARSPIHHTGDATQIALQAELAVRLATGDQESGRVSFCSLPQRIGSYLVSVVLQLDGETFAAHGALPSERTGASQGAAGSLLEATVEEFLSECSQTLSRPELGRFGATSREMPDLLRGAGKKLMHGPGSHMHGMTDLFDICNMISTMRYEGSASVGGMLVAPRERESVQVALSFGQPVSLRDFRTVRKLLEITGEGQYLLCADGDVYGLGGAESTDGAADDVFLMAFTGHYTWTLALGQRVLMEVTYGEPRLPKERIDYAEFRRHVEQTFASINANEIATLWGLVTEAAQQRHGTMVVVSSGAESEAQRLANQGISITPIALTPELMRLVTAIDGAVLIDPHNVCHAIGTILDGRATDAGDPSRGARFNSAVRYVDSSEHECLAIVVSEDGMINLVSNG